MKKNVMKVSLAGKIGWGSFYFSIYIDISVLKDVKHQMDGKLKPNIV